jgi:Tfp pilus assembly protein PilE
MNRPPGRHEAGESLIELLIAVAIMGIAVVAVVGLISTGIVMSDIHRKQATAGAYVRDYAEYVEKFVAAGNFDAAASPDYGPSTVNFPTPSGYTASVTSLRCWNDVSRQFSTCTAGSSVQQVTLRIASSDPRVSESLNVVIRKP